MFQALHLMLLVACGRGPTIAAVEPGEVPAGELLRVRGENFTDGAQVSLVAGDKNYPLEGVSIEQTGTLQGLVPLHAEPGTYDVVVTIEGAAHGLEQAVVVDRPRAEVPCSGEYTQNTQLSVARKMVVVDRFHRDGERETLKIPTSEIERIEYERVGVDDGLCSVIYLRRTGGARVIFDDDRKMELKERAQKMANDLGKPLEIIGEEPAPAVVPAR